ncbi:hypothetical protein HTZ77_02830 [Nonomuraea sp. SMC257]|uniref:Uncharacterized protein n=1 Tax=Nonomuraea montanisoli TaxID=2741721 RepID=A0A7Y6M1Q2_9ACTN|nr:hypothetical protein [Nonomuraea montanisoli]NUW30364.1 hypothetical protein [Nonomuraea montanisoli]
MPRERDAGEELEPARRTHRTDWMALLSGMLFVALGALVLTGELKDPLGLLVLLVVGLGFSGLVAVVARIARVARGR